MNSKIQAAVVASALALSAQAMAQITFYEGEDFHGRAFTAHGSVVDLAREGYNDRASSVIVDRGLWEVCEDARFLGHCVTLREGSYDSLRRLGVDNRLSSVRRVRGRDHREGPEPMAEPAYEYRRRPDERVFEAPVTSVHAVLGTSEQQCWVDREQVQEGRAGRNVGGGIVGALIGGVIGHQIGSGRGNDIATVGGAVAGAAIGSNQGRGSGETVERDVRHCETAPAGPPAYWDVHYRFHDVEHRVQMTAPPGPTIYVNESGDPRQ